MKRTFGLLGTQNVTMHAFLFGTAAMLAAFALSLWNRSFWDRMTNRFWLRFQVSGFYAGAFVGVMLTLVEAMLRTLASAGRPDLAATLMTPALLGVITVGTVIEVGFLGRAITEAEREWWARFTAVIILVSGLWVATFATVLYLPGLFLEVSVALRIAAATGWLGMIATSVIIGRNILMRVHDLNLTVGLLAAVAPSVFLVGLLGAVSLFAAYLVNLPPLDFFHDLDGRETGGFVLYLGGVLGASIWCILIWIAFCIWLFRLGTSLVDVNLFSLNSMYANRLVRCYLGASRARERREDDLTGFDPDDDLDLLDLNIGYSTYAGPHLLINTTLNLVGSADLALRDRKGDLFVLSPLFCGSEATGFARVTDDTRGSLTLGRALAVSGAAVDPNMPFYQSGALTALLTMLNARLGYWMENPALDGWSAYSPGLGSLLLKEFFGQTVGTGEYVHLSDGGHFENTGVYELIRRRCRYIVACDAGADISPTDENLSNLIRRCRIDLGLRIEIDTTPFRAEGSDRLPRAHAVAGRVRYDEVDLGQEPGVIIYIKISLILLCQLGRYPLWHAHEFTQQQLLGRFEPEPVADLAMYLRQ